MTRDPYTLPRIEKIVAEVYPNVSGFKIDHGIQNVQPVEYFDGLNTVREYPPRALWSVGAEKFCYVFKPKFKKERTEIPMGSFAFTLPSYEHEISTVLNLLKWSSEGKTAEEINKRATRMTQASPRPYLDANGREIKAGVMVVWSERGIKNAGGVEADASYSGGLRVGGRSVSALIDDADWVKVVT